MSDPLLTVQLKIEQTESRIANLESKLGLTGLDDIHLADKINYHLGVLSGLRFAMMAYNTEA